MSEVTKGNKVIYITCNRNELDKIPVIDGQLITFYDANGMYYDMNNARHQVGSSECVNKLPELGMPGTIYILLHSSDETVQDGVYIWDTTTNSYVSAIPKIDAIEDVPDDDHWYMRTKDKWAWDKTTYYIDDNDDVNRQFSKLQSFIDILSVHDHIAVVGTFKKSETDKTLTGSCSIDFSRCNFDKFISGFSTRDDKDDRWYYLKLSGFCIIVGLNCTRAFIEDSFTDGRGIIIQKCELTDSKCLINSEGSTISILGNKFYMSDESYIPIVFAPGTVKDQWSEIRYNHFRFLGNAPGCAVALSKDSTMIVKDNVFTFSYVIGYEDTFSFSDKFRNILSTPLVGQEDEDTTFAILSMYSENRTHWLQHAMPMKFLEDVSRIKDGPVNMFNIGDMFIIENDIVLGVANNGRNFVLEVNPKITTSIEELPMIESVTNSKYGQKLKLAKIGEIVNSATLTIRTLQTISEVCTPGYLLPSHLTFGSYSSLTFIAGDIPSIRMKIANYKTTDKAYSAGVSESGDTTSFKYIQHSQSDNSAAVRTGAISPSLDCRFLLYM